MIESEYGLTEMAFNAGRGAQDAGDENLLVKFYHKPRPDDAKSKEAGRPIFKEVVYIDIRQPGSRTSGVARPVRQTDIDRFPEHYKRFLARQDQEVHEGTPLAEWPGVTRAQVEEMKFFNVFTVEQLANMSDTNSGNFMGLQNLKAKAKDYIEAAAKNASAEALLAAEKRNEELEAKLAALMERVEAMETEPKPKRKRRTKAEMEAAQE